MTSVIIYIGLFDKQNLDELRKHMQLYINNKIVGGKVDFQIRFNYQGQSFICISK